ncbi:MAG: transposase [Desulfobacteraceae bacterium]|nr:transposase [Desulfobacteraceae bacterium]
MLSESDRLLYCDFCRVRSYLMPKGYFRYMLPHKAPEDKDLIWVPYWRLKGILYSTLMTGTQHRFIDASLQAMQSSLFPVSLGLRSQAMKLRLVASHTPGRFLHPDLPAARMLEIMNERFSAGLTPPILHQTHIGEALSLIYAPFYIEDRIVDAVLNRPIGSPIPEDFMLETLKGGKPDWPTGFLPTLCPECGWDMKGRSDSLALLCENCETVWNPDRNGLRSIPFAHVPNAFDNPVFLPFWRIKAKVKGLQLRSYADLVRTANLPRVVQEKWEEIGFRFWAPAFKIRPRVFLNLSRNLTLSQPRDKLVTRLPRQRSHPVNLPVREAVEGLKTILGSFIKPPQKMLPLLPDIVVKAKSFLLVWIPFSEGHHEYLNPHHQLAINKNQLSLAGNL